MPAEGSGSPFPHAISFIVLAGAVDLQGWNMAFSSPEMKVLEGADMQKLIDERITGETQVRSLI